MEIKSKADLMRFLGDLTEFERSVLVATFEIPRGRVTTYKHIAEKVGRPRAYRAVGNALHRNPLAPIIPCHRVVKSDGSLGGYGGGAEAKRRLLEEEGIQIRNGKVKLNKGILF
ncbi:MAG: MGMT family protein [Candidatus Bathyarchaeia archaeon]